VIRLGDGRALVLTLDFFTPICDDPETYGAIAATNALSDVWAMGGEPLAAMNITCWPRDTLPLEVLEAILRGSAAACARSGVMVVGGHTVADPELKFGLSVTGLVREDRVWRNVGARPGDVLVLTKPLGTGVISTAVKRDECPEEAEDAAIRSMLEPNRDARDAAIDLEIHACTDVTGNGLAGHAWEMARASGVRFELEAAALPLLPHAEALAAAGNNPGGAASNRAFVEGHVTIGSVSAGREAVFFDPQTSGGLLFALPPPAAAALLGRLHGWAVGRVTDGPPALHLRQERG
jgi:selenide,water dikinase